MRRRHDGVLTFCSDSMVHRGRVFIARLSQLQSVSCRRGFLGRLLFLFTDHANFGRHCRRRRRLSTAVQLTPRLDDDRFVLGGRRRRRRRRSGRGRRWRRRGRTAGPLVPVMILVLITIVLVVVIVATVFVVVLVVVVVVMVDFKIVHKVVMPRCRWLYRWSRDRSRCGCGGFPTFYGRRWRRRRFRFLGNPILWTRIDQVVRFRVVVFVGPGVLLLFGFQSWKMKIIIFRKLYKR